MNTIDLVWILASLASTLIGWWLARKLIASRRAADQREREEAAVVDLEQAMSLRDVDEARRDVRALLATRRGLLPIEASDAADEWLAGGAEQLRPEDKRIVSAARALAAELTKAHPGEPFAPKLSEAEKDLVAAVHASDPRWEGYDPGPRHRAAIARVPRAEVS